jgi:predicted nucleic acid-binding protein
MLYRDASLLVAALTNEAETERMQDWLGRQEDDLAISDWVATEFSAAFDQAGTGQIQPANRAEVIAMFNRLIADSFTTLPVSRPDFRMAAHLAGQYAPSRGGRRRFAKDEPREIRSAGALISGGGQDRHRASIDRESGAGIGTDSPIGQPAEIIAARQPGTGEYLPRPGRPVG